MGGLGMSARARRTAAIRSRSSWLPRRAARISIPSRSRVRRCATHWRRLSISMRKIFLSIGCGPAGPADSFGPLRSTPWVAVAEFDVVLPQDIVDGAGDTASGLRQPDAALASLIALDDLLRRQGQRATAPGSGATYGLSGSAYDIQDRFGRAASTARYGIGVNPTDVHLHDAFVGQESGFRKRPSVTRHALFPARRGGDFSTNWSINYLIERRAAILWL